ncbi:pyrroline-5-carboxylate reductase [Peptoniphilus stercorisuis]|uniref:Pyrroline-5-carboxylate reductase n=1 Tax=Peptoniphilus stercorisuis TaxID=1436965 RepID=A0ABS4KD09_9FIRM|nr:pyrroline-5-carboxylate reductase [Peptoniphilus stercorisuis]MBP2024499.1 pyrroline-5-carboxylate reductase [Peptoniphilus stercorisuis]
MKKIGIIGVGNMGGAIATALCKNKYDLILSNHSKKNLEKFENFENIKTTTSNIEVAKESDYIILAVKPNIYEKVINEINEYLTSDKVFISIAAGFSIKSLEEMLPNRKIVMTMPNTPAMVEEAITAICPNSLIDEKEIQDIVEIFSSFGIAQVLDEMYFPAFSGSCGCLPAYVYMFIEAASDAAVLNGMKRADAYKFIAQSVLGSAKMLLETNLHPGELKDMVTSPGGTTIEGVKALEDNGFRSAIISAIDASVKKSKNMGK